MIPSPPRHKEHQEDSRWSEKDGVLGVLRAFAVKWALGNHLHGRSVVRKVGALLVIAAAGFSCKDSGRTAGTASVTLKGRKIALTVFATERERRDAPLACTTLPDGRGYLLLWPRERFA